MRAVLDTSSLVAAVNGRADGLVTFNRRDFEPAARRFGVDVLFPAEVLANIEALARMQR